MGEDTSLLGNGQVQYHKNYSTTVFLVIFLNVFLKNLLVSEKSKIFFIFMNYRITKDALPIFLCALKRNIS